jgi:hypothetical protein
MGCPVINDDTLRHRIPNVIEKFKRDGDTPHGSEGERISSPILAACSRKRRFNQRSFAGSW